MKYFTSAKTLILSLIFFLLLAACSTPPQPKLQDNSGNVVNFAADRGKWLVINYWATWCEPCMKEMPALNAFYQAHKNKNLIMYGVSYDQVPPVQLAVLIKRIGTQFPTLTTDPAAILGLGDLSGLPATFIFAPNGQLKHVLLGGQTQQSLAAAIV